MHNKINESSIETYAIELLEKQGYKYIHAPDIAPDSEVSLPLGETEERGFARQSYEDVLLMERMRSAVGRINPSIPADVREDAVKQLLRLNSPELIANNEAFHRILFNMTSSPDKGMSYPDNSGNYPDKGRNSPDKGMNYPDNKVSIQDRQEKLKELLNSIGYQSKPKSLSPPGRDGREGLCKAKL